LVPNGKVSLDMLKYCKKCVMPHTKPDIDINADGVCNACRSYESRLHIDWEKRRTELVTIFKRYRGNDRNWDCIIPVSGGKDSTYQVLRIKQLGLSPLCVTATTCDLSPLGRKNIENIKRLGVDYVEFSPNPLVRAKLNRIGLTEVGDISWPEHVGIFTIPVRAAVHYNIPLIVWGENSQNEYGGPAAAAKDNVLTRRWLEEFGGLLGLRVSDLSDSYGIEPRQLLPYQYPPESELARVGVTGLFLGHYLPWDGLSNAMIAQAHGFSSFETVVEGSMANYENLDNHQTGIHDYFKFLKFGFSRATDIACLHVRRGRITRSEAMEIVKHLDGRFPATYLGKPIEKILEPLEMSVDEFIKVCDKFTNKKIFKKDASGALVKDRRGNLEKINFDNP
jgi:N-acetyl sugar amidotransferase